MSAKKLLIFVLLLNLSLPFEFARASDPALAVSAQDVFSKENTQGKPSFYLGFRNTKLINVLNLLSELSGINFVAGKEVEQRQLNMILDGISLDDALDTIARGTNVNYQYMPERNVYFFRASADAENLPPLSSRVFRLYYAMASPIREIDADGDSGSFANLSEAGGAAGATALTSPILTIVQNMLSERGRVNVDSRSNSLIVTDIEGRLNAIERVIVELDKKQDQVLIEVVIIEAFDNLDRYFGVEWSSIASQGTFGTLTGGITTSKVPFNWTPIPNSNKPLFYNKDVPVTEQISTTLPDTTTYGTNDFSNLTVTFKALEAAQKIRVIAKPKILVLDNNPALVKITTNAAIGQNSVSTATGQLSSAATTTTERTETGTALRITPHINTEGLITMTLEPRFVTVAASSVSSLANSTADATVRTARTTLMVKSGQTIVLGGLLSSQQSKSNRKVPFIGEIPGFGEIFNKRDKSMADRELILFVTPRIIKDTAELEPLSVPDQRDNIEDEKAPFWRVKKKKWYKDLEEMKMQNNEIGSQDREFLMDEAMRKLGAEKKTQSAAGLPPQAEAKPAVLAPAPKTAPKILVEAAPKH